MHLSNDNFLYQQQLLMQELLMRGCYIPNALKQNIVYTEAYQKIMTLENKTNKKKKLKLLI